MGKIKSKDEVLAEIYRNAQLALQSISDILPETEEDGIRKEILRQQSEYKRICEDAEKIARQSGIELKEPGLFKKAMMWSGIKMNTVVDKSSQHIAQLMVRGTAMGVTSLRTTQTDSEGYADGEIKKLLDELIAREEEFEENLKKFL